MDANKERGGSGSQRERERVWLAVTAHAAAQRQQLANERYMKWKTDFPLISLYSLSGPLAVVKPIRRRSCGQSRVESSSRGRNNCGGGCMPENLYIFFISGEMWGRKGVMCV